MKSFHRNDKYLVLPSRQVIEEHAPNVDNAVSVKKHKHRHVTHM